MAANPRNVRWQDWVTLVVGVWLFFSPWILGFYSEIPAASWNFFVVGVAFVAFAAFAMNQRSLWEEWVNLVLGVWMIVSPWVLLYSGNTNARDDAIIIGLVAAVMTIWTLAAKRMRIGNAAADGPMTH